MVKIIKKILLCPPEHFQIQYQINPWMANKTINRLRAKNQWLKLVDTCQRLNIQTDFIKPQRQLPDMVFAADQGLIKNHSVILANFRFQERKPETKIYRDWFKTQNFKILQLPKNLYFEGGDALDLGNKIILGHGFRTSPKTSEAIANLFKTPVFGLKLIDPCFYHLDTCLFPLNEKTAFYYPPAFNQASQKKLINLFPRLIALPKKEAFDLAANSLNTDHQVITNQKANFFTKKLAQLGYRVYQVNVSEFIKSGGGIHCLTIATETN